MRNTNRIYRRGQINAIFYCNNMANSIILILIFFKGATRKEKDMEIRMRLLGNEEDK